MKKINILISLLAVLSCLESSSLSDRWSGHPGLIRWNENNQKEVMRYSEGYTSGKKSGYKEGNQLGTLKGVGLAAGTYLLIDGLNRATNWWHGPVKTAHKKIDQILKIVNNQINSLKKAINHEKNKNDNKNNNSTSKELESIQNVLEQVKNVINQFKNEQLNQQKSTTNNNK